MEKGSKCTEDKLEDWEETVLTGYMDFPDFPSFPPIFNKANKNHCKVWIRKVPKK